MPVYKLYPIKDATLYSTYTNMNTGLDEILEVSTTQNGDYDNANPQVSRALIKFDTTAIQDIINNKISGSIFDINLKMYAATITGLLENTVVESHVVSQDWENGIGKYQDNPINTQGVSWVYRTYSGSGVWSAGTYSSNTTGSFLTSSVLEGGGTWYITGSSYNPTLTVSSSFGLYDDKDLTLHVSSSVLEWYSGNLANYGFILKQSGSQEFVDNVFSATTLKYFSRDTHTIYPPYLEFKWKNYSFTTGSSTQTRITSSNAYIALHDNQGIFQQDAVNRFRVYSRPKNPTRVFQTSSIHTSNYYLPESASFALKDLETNEFIINFDTNFTLLSADSESSYFDIYMSGLEPERNYKVLISCSLGGNQYIIDNKCYFKVVNG